jgi:hypothetical protein
VNDPRRPGGTTDILEGTEERHQLAVTPLPPPIQDLGVEPGVHVLGTGLDPALNLPPIQQEKLRIIGLILSMVKLWAAFQSGTTTNPEAGSTADQYKSEFRISSLFPH